MKDKFVHEPAPMTARMLLESSICVSGSDADKRAHSLCSVYAWGPGARGVLWIRCTCPSPAIVTVPDTHENRLSLRNMPKVI